MRPLPTTSILPFPRALSNAAAPAPAADLLTAVGDLYQAALEPGHWPNALSRLAQAVGAVEAILRVESEGGVAELVLQSEVPPGRVGQPVEESTLDWHVAGLRLRLRLDFVPGTCDIEARLTLGALVPHVERAARLALAGAPLHGARAALDRLAAAVLLVDAAGRVAVANRSARELLEQSELLALPNGRLRALHAADRTALKKLLGAALAPVAPDRRGRGGVVTLRGAGSSRPLQIVAAPLEGGFDTGSASPVAVLLLGAGRAPTAGLAGALATAYGLTPGEARVALALLEGADVEGAAARLRISRETVRTHLKRLFDKVGTTRQADLLRLLLEGAGRVRWD